MCRVCCRGNNLPAVYEMHTGALQFFPQMQGLHVYFKTYMATAVLSICFATLIVAVPFTIVFLSCITLCHSLFGSRNGCCCECNIILLWWPGADLGKALALL